VTECDPGRGMDQSVAHNLTRAAATLADGRHARTRTGTIRTHHAPSPHPPDHHPITGPTGDHQWNSRQLNHAHREHPITLDQLRRKT
jgi:hypothetical protein